MGDFLLVTIQVDMHDRLAMTLQDDLTNLISRTGSRGVLIDISSLDMVDSFIGRMLANIAQMSRVLDARTVVTGMRPAVAITLVELGMSLAGVHRADRRAGDGAAPGRAGAAEYHERGGGRGRGRRRRGGSRGRGRRRCR